MRSAIIIAATLICGMAHHLAHLIKPDAVPQEVSWAQAGPAIAVFFIFSTWDWIEFAKKRGSK